MTKPKKEGLGTLDNVDDHEELSEEDAEALAFEKKGKGKGKGFKGECYNCHKTGHRAADCWAKGGGKEGGQKGQKGGYGKGPGGGIIDAIFGQGHDKGKGTQGKSWEKGARGALWARARGRTPVRTTVGTHGHRRCCYLCAMPFP